MICVYVQASFITRTVPAPLPSAPGEAFMHIYTLIHVIPLSLARILTQIIVPPQHTHFISSQPIFSRPFPPVPCPFPRPFPCTSIHCPVPSLHAQLQGSLMTRHTGGGNNSNSSSSSSFVAVGAESGVVTLFYLDRPSNSIGMSRGSGVHRNHGTSSSSSSSFPRTMKSIMNLTTKITAIAFHPSGELVIG